MRRNLSYTYFNLTFNIMLYINNVLLIYILNINTISLWNSLWLQRIDVISVTSGGFQNDLFLQYRFVQLLSPWLWIMQRSLYIPAAVERSGATWSSNCWWCLKIPQATHRHEYPEYLDSKTHPWLCCIHFNVALAFSSVLRRTENYSFRYIFLVATSL